MHWPAYVFPAPVEHRIQYLDDQQTHVLPTRDDDLAWIARTMGHTTAAPFCMRSTAHRELVAQEFDTLLGGNGKKECNGGARRAARVAAPPPELEGC
jgi:glutamate-ammonia-ligase adenylyltransferase